MRVVVAFGTYVSNDSPVSCIYSRTFCLTRTSKFPSTRLRAFAHTDYWVKLGHPLTSTPTRKAENSSTRVQVGRLRRPSTTSSACPHPHMCTQTNTRMFRIFNSASVAGPAVQIPNSHGNLGIGIGNFARPNFQIPVQIPKFQRLVLGCIEASKQASKFVPSHPRKKLIFSTKN